MKHRSPERRLRRRRLSAVGAQGISRRWLPETTKEQFPLPLKNSQRLIEHQGCRIGAVLCVTTSHSVGDLHRHCT